MQLCSAFHSTNPSEQQINDESKHVLSTGFGGHLFSISPRCPMVQGVTVGLRVLHLPPRTCSH